MELGSTRLLTCDACLYAATALACRVRVCMEEELSGHLARVCQHWVESCWVGVFIGHSLRSSALSCWWLSGLLLRLIALQLNTVTVT